MTGDIVTVDRPPGSCHPVHECLDYPVNDGIFEGLVAAGGEESYFEFEIQMTD